MIEATDKLDDMLSELFRNCTIDEVLFRIARGFAGKAFLVRSQKNDGWDESPAWDHATFTMLHLANHCKNHHLGRRKAAEDTVKEVKS